MPQSEITSGKRVHLARLPPLNALRAFVVTARHLSFTMAAAELHVSNAAIGQQIRLLEEHLGGPLFERNRGRLDLTALGASLAPGLDEAFDLVVDTLARIGDGAEPVPMKISVPPSFALKWLMPRLDALHAAVPGLELVVDASTRLTEFGAGEADCAIRYGLGGYAGLRVEHLLSEAVLPVCSPSFAEAYRLAERGPGALSGDVPLLHEVGPETDLSCPGWDQWLRAEGVAVPEGRRGIRLQQSSLVLEAAASGKGIGLGKLRLAEADLAAGRLVSPFGRPVPVRYGYFFVAPPEKARLPAVNALFDWLSSEAALATAGLAPRGLFP